MYFPKQHHDSIVPEKSGINRFSASQFTIAALWLTSQLAEGRNSVEQKVIVPGAVGTIVS